MARRRTRSGTDAFAILLLLILTAVYFQKLISPDVNYLPADLLKFLYPWQAADVTSRGHNRAITDVLQFMYPSYHFFRDSLLALNVPLWNPHAAAGTPFAADCVNGVFYPLNTLLLLLLPAEKAIGATAALHVFLSGMFMFLLLRYFRIERVPALLSAVIYIFAGPYTVWRQFPDFINGVPWLPAAVLFLEIAIRRRKKTAALVSGAMVGLQMLAGNLQSASFTFVVLALLALFRCFVHDRSESPNRKFDFFPITALVVAVLSSAVIASVQLIQTAGLFAASHRFGGRPGGHGFGSVFSPLFWGTAFIPDLLGNPVKYNSLAGGASYVEQCVYCGVAAVWLAFLSLTVKRNKATLFFPLLALVAFLFMTGSPLYNLYYYMVPGAKAVSASRFNFVFAFAMAASAGVGLHVFSSSRFRDRKSDKAAYATLIVFAATAAVFLFESLRFVVDVKHMTLSGLLHARVFECGVFIVMLIAVVLAVLLRRRIRPSFATFALLVLCAADVIIWGYDFNPYTKQEELFPGTRVMNFLSKDKSVWRLNAAATPAVLVPNTATVYGIDDVRSYGSLYLGRYYKLMLELSRRNGYKNVDVLTVLKPYTYDEPLLDFLNVKYFMTTWLVNTNDFRPAFAGESLIYRNLRSLPRVMLVSNWETGTDDKILDHVTSRSFTPDRIVYLSEDPELRPNPGVGRNNALIKIIEKKSDRMRLKVFAVVDGILTISENNFPGWKARVDGKPTRIITANYSFMGVPMQAGPHSVELVFEPPHAAAATFAGIIAALLCVVAAISIRPTKKT